MYLQENYNSAFVPVCQAAQNDKIRKEELEAQSKVVKRVTEQLGELLNDRNTDRWQIEQLNQKIADEQAKMQVRKKRRF